MLQWKNDDELFALIKAHLHTSVIGDIMDKLNLLHQFLPPHIQPLREDMIVAGRAMTVLEADTGDGPVPAEDNPLLQKPFGLMLEALDDLKRNEVYICTGSSPAYALWGELMSTRAMKLGAAGAVVNGYSRDTKGIWRLNFPVFSSGRYAQDQAPRGKVVDFRIPIVIEGVSIHNGDIVIGDLDGVCIMPKQVEAEVFRLALEKVSGEKTVQKRMEEGMSAKDAFDKYGIM